MSVGRERFARGEKSQKRKNQKGKTKNKKNGVGRGVNDRVRRSGAQTQRWPLRGREPRLGPSFFAVSAISSSASRIWTSDIFDQR